jgi:Arm DNA-binding domain
MATLRNKLTDIKCRTAGVGTYGDGGGLYLVVQQGVHGLRRNWLFRFMIAGRARGMGLGSYPDISLQRAREKAQESRTLKAEGVLTQLRTNTLSGLPGVAQRLSHGHRPSTSVVTPTPQVTERVGVVFRIPRNGSVR